MTARHVLIIDDEADIREVARLSLERLGGYTVTVAPSGSEGVAAATAGAPDAVLLDVMMPGMDGPATISALRVVMPGLPVVFLTANPLPVERERLLALGAQGVLSKPFDPRALPKQVAAVLGWDG